MCQSHVSLWISWSWDLCARPERVLSCPPIGHMGTCRCSWLLACALNPIRILTSLSSTTPIVHQYYCGTACSCAESNPVGRLGWYYSRKDSFSDMLFQATATESCESLNGVDQVCNEKRVSSLLKHTDIEQYFVLWHSRNKMRRHKHC